MYQRRRARILLAMLVLAALVLITVDFRTSDDSILDRGRGMLTTVFRPVQEGLVTLISPVGDAANAVTDIFRVRAENERLRERLSVLEERRRSVTDLERENEELRALLELRDRTGLETIAARTVALGPSNFEWTITIDRGSNHGVERDMPVISAAGLVGRVIQTTPNASRVLLAIDPNFAASARVARNGETGMIDGRGGDPMLFRPLDPEADIQVGDEIVTNSYQGGTYPGGIPIGTVASVGDASTLMSLEVQVRPYVDFTRLHHLLVIVHAAVDEIPPFTGVPDVEFTPPPVSRQPAEGPEDDTGADDDDPGGEADGDDA